MDIPLEVGIQILPAVAAFGGLWQIVRHLEKQQDGFIKTLDRYKDAMDEMQKDMTAAIARVSDRVLAIETVCQMRRSTDVKEVLDCCSADPERMHNNSDKES